MEKSKLNQDKQNSSEQQYIEQVRKMSYKQRFEKFCAIYELSYMLKKAKKVANPLIKNEQTDY